MFVYVTFMLRYLYSNVTLKTLAKTFGTPSRGLTHQVVTRWYRSPELLFGARYYGTGVDMWAVGCIGAELVLRKPFLTGDSDLSQLTKIFEICGSPSEEQWPGVSKLPDYIEYKEMPNIPFADIFTAASDDFINLLQCCLVLDPTKRCTATQALKSPYFRSHPVPTTSSELPVPKSKKEKYDAELSNVKRGLFK